jgi:hypothetical protein
VVEDIARFLRDDEQHQVFLDRHPTDGILALRVEVGRGE